MKFGGGPIKRGKEKLLKTCIRMDRGVGVSPRLVTTRTGRDKWMVFFRTVLTCLLGKGDGKSRNRSKEKRKQLIK